MPSRHFVSLQLQDGRQLLGVVQLQEPHVGKVMCPDSPAPCEEGLVAAPPHHVLLTVPFRRQGCSKARNSQVSSAQPFQPHVTDHSSEPSFLMEALTSQPPPARFAQAVCFEVKGVRMLSTLQVRQRCPRRPVRFHTKALSTVHASLAFPQAAGVAKE